MAFRSVRGAPGRHAAPWAPGGSAGDELARLYAEHSRPLLQLAALLVPDIHAAREIVYEAFAAFHRGKNRPRRSDDVFMVLLRTVVHRARTTISAVPDPGMPAGSAPGCAERGGTGGGAGQPDTAVPGSAVLGALRELPGRQREALVLRYYGQLSDEQAATAMGVRPAELRANVARGMAALRAVLTSSAPGPPQ